MEEDPMCPLCEKKMIPVYTFLEDAVSSLRNKENSLENISYFQAN